MKAIVVSPYYYPEVGGLEVYARQLSLSLQDRKNWEIVVITSGDSKSHSVVEEVDGMKIYRLATWFKFSNTPINLAWPFMIRTIVRREKPDVIFAHTPVPSMADATALGKGHVPLVLIYHASTLLKNNAFLFNLLARSYSQLQRITFSRASAIVAVSDYVKGEFSRRIHAKTVVIPNAVWNKQITTRKQPTTNDLLFIGSLHRSHAWKGLNLIIEALAYYKQNFPETVHLTVMGDGNDRQGYEKLVFRHNLDKVITFVGIKTGEEKEAILNAATAMICYPTTSNDAFPTVMLEAWARGVPVVGAAIGPIPSLIKDGVNGLLVEPHNPIALAQCLRNIITMPLKEKSAIASYAAEQTRQNFTWEIQADAIDHLVAELQ